MRQQFVPGVRCRIPSTALGVRCLVPGTARPYHLYHPVSSAAAASVARCCGSPDRAEAHRWKHVVARATSLCHRCGNHPGPGPQQRATDAGHHDTTPGSPDSPGSATARADPRPGRRCRGEPSPGLSAAETARQPPKLNGIAPRHPRRATVGPWGLQPQSQAPRRAATGLASPRAKTRGAPLAGADQTGRLDPAATPTPAQRKGNRPAPRPHADPPWAPWHPRRATVGPPTTKPGPTPCRRGG